MMGERLFAWQAGEAGRGDGRDGSAARRAPRAHVLYASLALSGVLRIQLVRMPDSANGPGVAGAAGGRQLSGGRINQ
jgi:hypothetical protein